VPTRRRLDVDAFYRMAEAGILAWGERVELIDGEIIDKGPIGSDHGGMTDRLDRLFAKAVVEGRIAVGVQRPVRLDAYNEPQPDVVLMRPRADDYRSGHPTAADVLLIVEVANSSLAFDRGTKLPLYARFAVPEVWIVDLAGRAVELYGEPEGGTYRRTERVTEGTLRPSTVGDVEIDVAALLA
jgi:Uma2 family endonuclease